jgi:dihydroorotate dehydrogenase
MGMSNMWDAAWRRVLRPLLFGMDAERAHELALSALKRGLGPPRVTTSDAMLRVERFGLRFSNPLGVAAGFDKNALVAKHLIELGFGHVEIGTVTLRPQTGNEKPRLFRLPADEALLNRMGFNNDGADAVAARLSGVLRNGVIGVNMGRNKDVPNNEAADSYASVLEIVHPYADYLVINVSSPNTAGLRELQRAENLRSLIRELQLRNQSLGAKPLLVKIAPELTRSELRSIAEVCVEERVSGIIATNTLASGPVKLKTDIQHLGPGGISGAPLRGRSNAVISHLYRCTAGKLPIIGVGGIFDAADTFEKIAAGASLVQAYTGFIYRGPVFPRMVTDGLCEILTREGLSSIDAAVGCMANIDPSEV